MRFHRGVDAEVRGASKVTPIESPPPGGQIDLWAEHDVRVRLAWAGASPVCAEIIRPANGVAAEGSAHGRDCQPLVELLVAGEGRRSMNLRHTATAVAARLRYRRHSWRRDGGWNVVEIEQGDERTGLICLTELRVPEGATALEARTTIRHDGFRPVWIQAVSSLMLGRPLAETPMERIVLIQGTNEWVGENRWHRRSLRAQDGFVELDLPAHQRQDRRSALAQVSTGGWSSGQHVPCGILAADDDSLALAWQVQHNGSWRSEIDARLGRSDSEYPVLGLFGPTDIDHAWTRRLSPGECFTSVPVSMAASTSGWAGAIVELTSLRRRLRPATGTQGVIFNDYMNTLMGDPTTAKLVPLIDAAARVGVKYFCIDCGWYDDTGDWWDSVGQWLPSSSRFPGGLDEVIGRIRDHGMVPGIWLEPEVVGVRSAVARELPDAAFLQRNGVRTVEHDRHLLDLRHPAARDHLDTVVDRLVERHGVGYLKLDYNVAPGLGTDLDAHSAGDGLLRHNLAHLEWIERVLARHPELVIENCASGAMRADYAMLSRLHLQSTSDQQNPLLYPPIAVGALLSILPEQAANWAYPQPSMTPEQIVFTLCTGLAGRLQLSGHIDRMSAAQLALVSEAVGLSDRWGERLAQAVPFWPLGLPDWRSPWVAVGLRAGRESMVIVWSRGDGTRGVELDVPGGEAEIAYPVTNAVNGWEVRRTSEDRLAVATTSAEPQARVLRITHV